MEPQHPVVADVVRRNIHTLIDMRRQFEQRKSAQDRIADGITRFAGSLPFVYLHAVFFGGWIVVNLGLVPGVRPFDPFPFVMLAMWASVEAIFLSTFVLISQNRMALLADRRAELDLQISLLSEHEITRVLTLVDAMADRLGVHVVDEREMKTLEEDVDPEAVLQEIEEAEEEQLTRSAAEDPWTGWAADDPDQPSVVSGQRSAIVSGTDCGLSVGPAVNDEPQLSRSRTADG